jgi:NAD-dependent deacetylase
MLMDAILAGHRSHGAAPAVNRAGVSHHVGMATTPTASSGRPVPEPTDAVARLIELWATSDQVVVLTGAGISTDSGIADFRGPNGVWTKDPAAADLFEIHAYLTDPDIRRRAWAGRRSHPAWTAEPNAGHRALADLEAAGRCSTVLTQNIDGLHQRAGSRAVLELHGTLWQVGCLTCKQRWPTPEVLVWAGDDPHCPTCGGILKTATVSFGQALDPVVLDRAVDAAAEADLLVAIGTSLQVNPVAGLAGIADRLAIVNAQPTPYDNVADVLVGASISTVLTAVRDALT